MDQGPLVGEQIEAGARFLAEFQKYRPVQCAFWLKDSEYGEWYLYVASEQINDDNIDVGYEEVLTIAAQKQDSVFDPFQVKLVGDDHPLAKAALDFSLRHPGRTSIGMRGKAFGGMSVDEMYIYRAAIPASAP